MSAVELLQELRKAGVLLWVDGNKLRCKGPEEVLTAEALNNLREIKTEVLQLLTKKKKLSNRATGYGCVGCGNKIYQVIQGWKTKELTASSPWMYEHVPVIHWKCEDCGAVFEIIGGSRGPQPLN
jgi:hypothetical protein